MITATEMQLANTQRDMGKIAQEPVKVEQISGALYAFGSEIATLRLFAKYNSNGAHPNPKTRVGYSVNMNTHFFVLELP